MEKEVMTKVKSYTDESSPLDIAITDALYLKTEKGIYRRALQPDCTDFEHPKRKYASYYD